MKIELNPLFTKESLQVINHALKQLLFSLYFRYIFSLTTEKFFSQSLHLYRNRHFPWKAVRHNST